MLVYIFLGLFVLACAQFVMIKLKKAGNESKLMGLKVQELMEYMDSGNARVFDGEGRNILMIATSENTSDMIPVMDKAISYGISINDKSKRKGNTAIHYACLESFSTEIIEFLLKRGADSNILNDDGINPFWNICKMGNYNAFDMVLPRTFDLNIADNLEGHTPLMIAASEGHAGIVHKLLDAGMNAKQISKDGGNAYMIAKKNVSRHYKHSGNSTNVDEFYERQNHNLDEMVRRLKCIIEDKTFKPRKFVRNERNINNELEVD